jgi:hypothetical protein
MTCGACETAVAGDEGRVERLSESDIDGVVRGQVCPQLPYAWDYGDRPVFSTLNLRSGAGWAMRAVQACAPRTENLINTGASQ